MSPKKWTAVYAGRRTGFIDKKVRQLFIRSDGDEMHFRGIKGVRIGKTYVCDEKSIKTRPEWVHDVETIENAEWEAADALVDAENARKRARGIEARLEKPKLKAAIEALRPLVENLGHFEKKTLIDYLAHTIKPKKGKR